MEITRKYLFVIELEDPKAAVTRGAAIKAELVKYSIRRPPMVFGTANRMGFFIETALPLKELKLDGHLLNGDSCLIVELGQRHVVEGYALRDLYAWL